MPALSGKLRRTMLSPQAGQGAGSSNGAASVGGTNAGCGDAAAKWAGASAGWRGTAGVLGAIRGWLGMTLLRAVLVGGRAWRCCNCATCALCVRRVGSKRWCDKALTSYATAGVSSTSSR